MITTYKAFSVILLIWFPDNTVTSLGQFYSKGQCQAVVNEILYQGVKGEMKFQCYDYDEESK